MNSCEESKTQNDSECSTQVQVGNVTINNNRAGKSAGCGLVTPLNGTNVGSFTLNPPSAVNEAITASFPSCQQYIRD